MYFIKASLILNELQCGGPVTHAWAATAMWDPQCRSQHIYLGLILNVKKNDIYLNVTVLNSNLYLLSCYKLLVLYCT